MSAFAQVAAVRGKVAVACPGCPDSTASVGQDLPEGTVLGTAEGSEVAVRFADGRVTRIGELGRIRLVSGGLGHEAVPQDEVVVYGTTHIATLSRTAGDVKVLRGLTVIEHRELFEGDLILTGEKSRAIIDYPNGERLIVSENGRKRVPTSTAPLARSPVGATAVEVRAADGTLEARSVTVLADVGHIRTASLTPGA